MACAIDPATGDPQHATSGGSADLRRELLNSLDYAGISGVGGKPSSRESFFWTSMIVSARESWA